MTRTFISRTATREKTPILVGLVGPSGSGKTYSALRLAAGFQRVSGGKTFFIDTEARRALHYADRFTFEHVPFGAPFSSLDYLDAIEYCIAEGATTIVVDSMSHEHEGPGGMLEMHAAEHKRLGGQEKHKLMAWAKPKAERRRLINTVLQMSCNFIFCFRAKEKLKVEPGKSPVPLGFMPIAGEEFVYEMTLKCLLHPGANGFPTWQPTEIGERGMVKLPEQFLTTFAAKPQLTEDVGQTLATWAAGTGVASAPVAADDLVRQYDACHDAATLRTLEDARKIAWSKLSKDDKQRVKTASEVSTQRVADATFNTEVEAVADDESNTAAAS